MFVIAARGEPPSWEVGLAIGAIVVLAWVLTLWQYSRVKGSLRALAERLGFTVTPDCRIPSLARSCNNQMFAESMEFGIQGQLRGRTVRFSRYVTGHGKGKQVWVELAVTTPTHSPSL